MTTTCQKCGCETDELDDVCPGCMTSLRFASERGSAMNRWQLARVENQYRMLAQSEHAQEDRISEHYSAFAHMAMQLRMLCEERRLSGSNKLDETIKYLTSKIREGHQMEFGILLEWPNDPDQRPGANKKGL